MPSPVSAEVGTDGNVQLLRSRLVGWITLRFWSRRQVALVDRDEGGTACDGGEHAALFVVQRLGCIQHDQHQRASASASRLRAMPSCSTSSTASRRPAVSTSSRGIPSSEMRSVTRSRVVPGVAVTMARSRSTSRLKSELLPALGRPTIASVSPSCTMRPRANEASSAASGGIELGDAASDLGLRRDVDIVFGKVDAGFEQRDQFDQGLLHGRDAAAERAAHLAGGLARLGERLRVDQVADRLGLRQVELAGEKCALSEFAGLGQPRAQLERAPQQQIEHHRRSVRGNLYEVFAGVGIGRGEQGDHRLVDAARRSTPHRARRPAGRARVPVAGAGAPVARRSKQPPVR